MAKKTPAQPAKGKTGKRPGAPYDAKPTKAEGGKGQRPETRHPCELNKTSTVSGFPLTVFLYPKRGETICSLTDSSMNSSV